MLKARREKFQFQTGSIKRPLLWKWAKVSRLFQFQTGSIKRHVFDESYEPDEAEFQFQTGSIKS